MKFVAVLNEKYTAEQLLSALGHCAAGLAANRKPAEEMDFVVYEDASGEKYPNISSQPFIVLGGKPSHLKKFRSQLEEEGIQYACYLDTMISGGSEAQVEATKLRATDELDILAIATFGPAEVLNPLTKRFSLWK